MIWKIAICIIALPFLLVFIGISLAVLTFAPPLVSFVVVLVTVVFLVWLCIRLYRGHVPQGENSMMRKHKYGKTGLL